MTGSAVSLRGGEWDSDPRERGGHSVPSLSTLGFLRGPQRQPRGLSASCQTWARQNHHSLHFFVECVCLRSGEALIRLGGCVLGWGVGF